MDFHSIVIKRLDAIKEKNFESFLETLSEQIVPSHYATWSSS